MNFEEWYELIGYKLAALDRKNLARSAFLAGKAVGEKTDAIPTMTYTFTKPERREYILEQE